MGAITIATIAGVIVAAAAGLGIPALIAAKSLTFFAGKVEQALADHERRLKVLETNERETAIRTAEIHGEVAAAL
jgi:hypothetical protein